MNNEKSIMRFRNQIMHAFYQLSCTVYTEGNYDYDRFGPVDNGLINKYDINNHISFLYYFLENTAGFYKTRDFLSDDQSKNIFVELLLYKLLGFPHVKLSTNSKEYWEMIKFNQSLPSKKSKFDLDFLGSKIRHYEFKYLGQKLFFDGLAGLIFLPMYDYKNGDETVMVENDDVVYDCGACMGDSTQKFAVQAGKNGTVEAFDFLPNHINITTHNALQNPDISERIKVHPFAVGEKTQNIDLAYQNNQDTLIKPGASIAFGNDSDVPMVSLDDWCKRGKIKAPNYIKMDIEGYERPALLGAKKLIQKHKPKLAISLYHKVDDFVTIPALLKSMVPEYKFYLGHYTIHHEETVLYAKVS